MNSCPSARKATRNVGIPWAISNHLTLYPHLRISTHTLQMWLPGWITVQGGPWYPNPNAGSPLEWSLHHLPAAHPPQGSFGTPLYVSSCRANNRSSQCLSYLLCFTHYLLHLVTPSSPAFQNNPPLPGTLPETFLTSKVQWTTTYWNSQVNIDANLSHHLCYVVLCSVFVTTGLGLVAKASERPRTVSL